MSESTPSLMVTLAEQLATIDEMLSEPELQRELGDGLGRELRTVIVGFRQRHAGLWPSPQAELF